MRVATAVLAVATLVAPPRIERLDHVRVPRLRGAVALATLVALDPRSKRAELRVRCGWRVAPKRRVRPGLWLVDLRGLDFGVESNPTNPGEGHVDSVPLRSWERIVERRGWTGTIRLGRRAGGLSDGPTTDVCGGVLG